jgi:hypothetical protein
MWNSVGEKSAWEKMIERTLDTNQIMRKGDFALSKKRC